MRKVKTNFYISLLILAVFVLPSTLSAQALRNRLNTEAQQEIIGIHPSDEPPIVQIGIFKFGEPFFKKKLVFGATGIVEGNIITDNGFFTAKELTIPSGTPVFAVNITTTISGATGGYAVGNGVHSIVKWCGNVSQAHHRLNNGTGFCISHKFRAADRTLADNMMFEINPWIETIGPSTSRSPKSVFFPVALGIGGTIKSDYQIVKAENHLTANLELRNTVVLNSRGETILRSFGYDGENEILISEEPLNSSYQLIVPVGEDRTIYLLEKISETEFQVSVLSRR